MGQTLGKTDNELILQRRRKRKIRKTLMLFLLLLSLFVTLCLKHPYFNIKKVEVYGNKNIVSKDIISLSNITLGNNIFYIDLKDAENNILRNPYIETAKISRKLPTNIRIDIKEREAVFYNGKEKNYFVIDKNGTLLQKRDNIDGMKLIKLDGLDYTKTGVGKLVEDKDKRKIEAIALLGDLIGNSKTPLGITSIDISNSVDIKAYFGNIYVKLGGADDLEKKLNKALNILVRKELSGAKGYIDVSFDGNPVFFIEK